MNNDIVDSPRAARDAALPSSVGVLGVGVMGHPMARHLLAALEPSGGELVILERSAGRAADLVERGAIVVRSAAEMAGRAQVVVVMAPDLPQVVALIEGAGGLIEGAGGRTLRVVVGSTVSAPGLIALDRRMRELTGTPIRIVDAPVSGGQEGAEAGSLSIMAGGDADDLDAVWPVLSAYGEPRRLGGVGAGQTGKACNQLVVAATVSALGEAAVIAERAGLDLRVLFDLLGGGYAASRILETRGRRFIEDDFSVSGAARYMTKDLRAADELCAGLGVDARVLHGLFEDMVVQGYGDLDIAATKKLVAGRSTA